VEEVPASEGIPAEGTAPAETPEVLEEEGKSEEGKKEESELLTTGVESLAGDAKTVSILADELANEKVERIRTKRVRDDKPYKPS
jgi:hypothetical protein